MANHASSCLKLYMNTPVNNYLPVGSLTYSVDIMPNISSILLNGLNPNCAALNPRIGCRVLRSEHENLRVALEWSLGGGDVELGLKLVASLRDYWVMSSRYIEGEQWTQQALAKSEHISPTLRSRLLTTAGIYFVHFCRAVTRETIVGGSRRACSINR